MTASLPFQRKKERVWIWNWKGLASWSWGSSPRPRKGSPGNGQQHVLEHTHKEHANGKFEPAPSEAQWRIYKDAQGKVISDVAYDRYLPTLRFPCEQLGKDNTSWDYRPIDDCTASGLNGSTHTSEHLKMHGLGTLLACAHTV